MSAFEFTAKGLRIMSEMNRRDHWAARRRRRMDQALLLDIARRLAGVQYERVTLPTTVTLTRVAPRMLDSHDNLPGGFKGIVDAIARGLGVDDRDPRVKWAYDQRKGEPHEYAVVVRFESEMKNGLNCDPPAATGSAERVRPARGRRRTCA